jgi:hypothetical protein
MEDGLIAALFLLVLIVAWNRAEEYTSFNSQIADLAVLNERENGLHFKPSDFNQTDTKLTKEIEF